MKVCRVHERDLDLPQGSAGPLIDFLATHAIRPNTGGWEHEAGMGQFATTSNRVPFRRAGSTEPAALR